VDPYRLATRSATSAVTAGRPAAGAAAPHR
jgi:hypothetical protein